MMRNLEKMSEVIELDMVNRIYQFIVKCPSKKKIIWFLLHICISLTIRSVLFVYICMCKQEKVQMCAYACECECVFGFPHIMLLLFCLLKLNTETNKNK